MEHRRAGLGGGVSNLQDDSSGDVLFREGVGLPLPDGLCADRCGYGGAHMDGERS